MRQDMLRKTKAFTNRVPNRKRLELMSSGSLGTLTGEQEHALEVSQRAATRLEKLIEDLLMFSRASHGEVSFRQETLDIRGLATRALDAARPRAIVAGVDLSLAAFLLSWIFQ